MQIAFATPESLDVLRYEEQPELAIVSLMQLMSRFPERQSIAMADAILGHLCLLADDARYPEALRGCAQSLIETWAQLSSLAEVEECAGAVH